MNWLEPLSKPVVVWNGALETERIKAQQRHATPAVICQPANGHRDRVGVFLQKFPQAWTIAEMGRLLLFPQHMVHHAVRRLIDAGDVRREYPEERGRRGRPQRYRWIAR